MKEKYTAPQVEFLNFDYTDVVTASGPDPFCPPGHGHGNGHNNGRWGDGNPHSHNGGEGIGAWHGGKNHDNFP